MQYKPLPRKLLSTASGRRDRLRPVRLVALLVCLGAGPQVSAAGDAGIRCHVHLPMAVGGWNTVLAECDGRPVAIGASTETHSSATSRSLALDSEEYARDLQAIRSVLKSAPAPTPKLAFLGAVLLLVGVIAGLVFLLRGLLRDLPRIKPRRPVQAALPVATALEVRLISARSE